MRALRATHATIASSLASNSTGAMATSMVAPATGSTSRIRTGPNTAYGEMSMFVGVRLVGVQSPLLGGEKTPVAKPTPGGVRTRKR